MIAICGLFMEVSVLSDSVCNMCPVSVQRFKDNRKDANSIDDSIHS